MSFADPLWLWGLLALPLLPLLEAWATGRDRARTARLVARPLWSRVVRRPSETWRFLRLGLLIVGAAGLLLALARPQWGIVREKVEREGVDVVLVVDTSGSMATADVSPSRFDLARTALIALLGRLPDDRFALVAFEGEAYPLVPLTLDTDAVGLFLESLEPGFVPTPGSSLGAGLAKGIAMFVDKGRKNKVLVLVSDGEDLEGEVDQAVKKAHEARVVVHTVGVGTEKGAPVPDYDSQGRQVGFKKDAAGNVVVSRMNPASLEAIAQGTSGRFFRLTPGNTSLPGLVGAIAGMEEKTLAREYRYLKKDRFQIPLGIGLGALALGLLLPPPRRRGGRASAARRAASLVFLLLFLPSRPARAAEGKALDEVLLKPRRLTRQGIAAYHEGNHPKALEDFRKAAALRPDARTRFNLAAGLYKNGKYKQAAGLYRSLAETPAKGLADAARFDLGNALFETKDYQGAVGAYRDLLRRAPGDPDAARNLELALRRLQQKKQQQSGKNGQQKQKQQQSQSDRQKKSGGQQKKGERQPKQGEQSRGAQPSPSPKTPEQKERERFERDAGMPKKRAMQLLSALQQNEKAEQRKALEARRAKAKARGGKDW